MMFQTGSTTLCHSHGFGMVPQQSRYEGSIQYAKCSQEADAVGIRREIGDKADEVDHAIHVLMSAGMSTPALRDIARSVDIQHAAFPEITGAIFLFGPFATNALTVTVVMSVMYNERLWYRAGLATVAVLSRFVLLVLLCRSDWDEQRFILKVMNKFLIGGLEHLEHCS